MPAKDDPEASIHFWMLGKVPDSQIDKEAKKDVQSSKYMKKVMETGVLDESRTAKCLLVPRASIGSAVEERHRVIQVCVGSQHGILLSDAGITFTWGDNRYGQLGRSPVLKEENGRPYPVLGLMHEEVLQVSAGTHHCLALVSPGLVWSWGRNKCGQLGVGDSRDRVQPVKVTHPARAENYGEGLQLGSAPGGRILSISAGLNSCVAAGLDSCVWQWGEINANFFEPLASIVAKDKASKKQGRPVNQNRPYQVFKKESFRTHMRQSKVSISETGCRVLDKDMTSDKERMMGLVEGVRQLQESINKERESMAHFDEEHKPRENEQKDASSNTFDGLSYLTDTIGAMERDIKLIEADIDAYNQSLANCNLRQAYNRNSLVQVQQQGTQLRDMKDKVSLEIFLAAKGGADRWRLEEKNAEFEEFVQANNHTRMTLLDQRAETDKEKQRIVAAVGEWTRQRARLVKRLETARDLNKNAMASSSGASDITLKIMQQITAEVSEHFERRAQQSDFLTAMKVFHDDRAFLDLAESKMQESADSTIDSPMASRANMVNKQLSDLVNLRRSWCDLLLDRWSKDSLDLGCFFSNSLKPGQSARETKGIGGASSVPETASLDFGTSFFASPDDALADRATPALPAVQQI